MAQVAEALGFQKTAQDSVLGIYWVYQAIDRFLALDLPQVLSDFTF